MGQAIPVVSYDTPQTFTAGKNINPLIPSSSGGALYPGIYSQPATFAAINTPFCIAVDNQNNVYTTDNTTGNLIKFSAAGDTIFSVSTGQSQASGLAVDNSGNIYVSQFTLNQILKFSADGKLTASISGFDDPYGIAFDAANNAYVANWLSGDILKIAANDTTAKPYLSGFKAPYGIAIDATGNMYVGEQGVGDIIKIQAGTTTKAVFATGFNGPRHLNKDNFGNIYVADFGNNTIKRISAAGVITNLFTSGLSTPRQAAFDSAGNLFIADFGNNMLKKSVASVFSINADLPNGLKFNTTTGEVTGLPTKVTPLTKYTVTASNTGGTSSATLAISVVAPLIDTEKITQTINFPVLASNIYGTNDLEPAAFASSNEVVTYSSSNTAVAVILNGKIHVVGAGTTVITASQPGNEVYNAAISVKQTLTINKAPLIVTAKNITIAYAAPIPLMTVTYSGFVNGDDANSLLTQPNVSTSAVTNSISGNYPIVASGAVSNNYYFIYQPGSLTINPGASIITFAALPAKTYGDADFNISAIASNNQPVTFVSDNTLVATVVNGIVHITGAGNVNITASQPGISSATTGQLLVVNKAAVTIKADAQTKTYGNTDIALTYNITAGSLFNKDTFSGSLIRNTGEQAGKYAIKKGTLGLSSNYILNYITDNLTIVPAPLTITADNKWITAGEALPVFTATYSGFVNNDTADKLTAAPNFTTVATNSSPAGTYAITPDGAISNNYVITYVPGTLIVNAATLSAQISDNQQVIVNQALSPNGDGINDFLMIKGIESHPENKVAIVNLNGVKVFETKNYDNSNKVFDGHSNINGAFQQPGTYFYKIDYTDEKQSKSQSGFIVIKY